jgi:hypothetical protein
MVLVGVPSSALHTRRIADISSTHGLFAQNGVMTETRIAGLKPKSLPLAWKLLVAASFLAYYTLMVYSELYEPGQTGITADFKDGLMQIRIVSPNTPGSRAGLKSGDVLRAVDEQIIRTWEDWRYFRATRQTGRAYSFQVERAGQTSAISVLLGRQSGDPLALLERKRYVQGALLVLALIVGFLRTEDLTALLDAWLLASIATAPFFPDAEMTAIWRSLPTPIGLLLWVPQISHLMLLPVLFSFLAVLPRPLFQKKWPWVIVWLPPLLALLWAAPLLYAHVYRPPLIGELPVWIRFVLGLAVVLYGGGGLVSLVLNYRRLVAPQERMRFRVMVLGALVGLSPLIPFLTAIFWGTLTESSIVWFFVGDSYRHSLIGMFLAFPLSLAYAIVRHRVLREPAPAVRDITA